MTPIQPRDYFSTPWMVQFTPGGRYRPLWEPLDYNDFDLDQALVFYASFFVLF